MLLAAVLAAEEGEEHNPVIPETPELVVGGIAFAILLFVLWKFVVPKFEAAYKARTEAIEGGIAKAEQAQVEAQAALTAYNAQLQQTRQESAAAREQARAEGAAILEEMRTKAQAEADRIVAQANAQIETQRVEAQTALRNEVGRLAVELANRIVGESLEDEARQRRVVDRFLAEIESGAGQAR